MRGGELVGVVSERDYARKVILLGRSSAETSVWQIMSSPVITVRPGETVRQLHGDHDRAAHPAPAGVEGGAMVGMVSIGDLVRAVIEEQQQTIEQLEKFIAG